jgi:hypothetical protein
MIGSISPELGALLFSVAIIALGVALLAPLYLAFRNEPVPEKKAPKRNRYVEFEMKPPDLGRPGQRTEERRGMSECLRLL